MLVATTNEVVNKFSIFQIRNEVNSVRSGQVGETVVRLDAGVHVRQAEGLHVALVIADGAHHVLDVQQTVPIDFDAGFLRLIERLHAELDELDLVRVAVHLAEFVFQQLGRVLVDLVGRGHPAAGGGEHQAEIRIDADLQVLAVPDQLVERLLQVVRLYDHPADDALVFHVERNDVLRVLWRKAAFGDRDFVSQHQVERLTVACD